MSVAINVEDFYVDLDEQAALRSMIPLLEEDLARVETQVVALQEQGGHKRELNDLYPVVEAYRYIIRRKKDRLKS